MQSVCEGIMSGVNIGSGELGIDWKPPATIQTAPVIVWPPRPLALCKYLFGFPGYLLPWSTLYAVLAWLSWRYMLPAISQMKSLSALWIGAVLLQNLTIVLLVASAWHWRLYVQRAQGTHYKYRGRWPSRGNSNFLFRDQVLDNVFWTVVSAVPIWTAYEALTLWAQSNGAIRVVTWSMHPIYCLLLMLLIPLIHEVHFYLIHRFLHWPPLYRAVHSLHHKNVNIGPWSGLAMHPVEHLVYFSGIFLYWLVPTHPLHVLFYFYYVTLTAIYGHIGFGKLELNATTAIETDSYFHYLHHKYFEVNYGDALIPLDEWLGTFHDGSARAHESMKRRVMKRSRAATSL